MTRSGADRAYWGVVLLLLALTAVSWISVLGTVYGWQMDDRMIFQKGSETVDHWRAAFHYYNALQPYFWFVSYLPLKSGFHLSFEPIPGLDNRTGQFRFLLAYTVGLHLVIAAAWAWFLPKISRNRAANAIAFFFWLSSPTFILWTPQPESRIIGLPCVLLGAVLLLDLDRLLDKGSGAAIAGRMVVCGTLFGLAQSLHYTALYIVGPLSAVFWISTSLDGRRWQHRRWWGAAAAFGAGLLWIPALIEWLSHQSGYSFAEGPLMTMPKLRAMHASKQPLAVDLAWWGDFFVTEMGYVLAALIVVGAWMYARGRGEADRETRNRRRVVAAILLALVYLLLSRSRPFFRQTSVVQPFLFLFAAHGIVGIAGRVARRRAACAAAAAILCAAAGWTQWREAHAVFEGHQGLGKAAQWAAAHKGSGSARWLQIAWFPDSTSLKTEEALLHASPDDLLISYFPWALLQGARPSAIPAFEDVRPRFAAPTLYGTGALRAEIQTSWPDFDVPREPTLAEARVYRIGDLARALDPPGKLTVRFVKADSVALEKFGPEKVFDRDATPGDGTAWVSSDAPGEHYLDIQFDAPVVLGGMCVVQPSTDRSEGRIVEAEAQDPAGATLWRGDGLGARQVLRPAWMPRALGGIRLVIRRTEKPGKAVRAARVEEITFPGYSVVLGGTK